MIKFLSQPVTEAANSMNQLRIRAASPFGLTTSGGEGLTL